MKLLRVLIAGVILACVGVVNAEAQCVVDTSTPTYDNGKFLRYTPCNENGAIKTTGAGGGSGDASAANQTTLNGYVGNTTDAVVAAGAAGSMSAKLRRLTTDLDALNTLITALSAKFPSAAAMGDDEANPTLSKMAVYNKCWDNVNSDWDRCAKGSAGAGNTDAGTQRVVIAKDSAVCNPKDTAQAVISTASSGNVELVALTAGQTIYVCDFTLVSTGTVAVQLVYGTGTACGTGETNMTGAMPFVANGGWTHNYDGRLKTAEANALCIELSAATQVDGVVTYRKAATF